MKILITGANGFMGKNLIARLEQQNTTNNKIYKYDIDTPYEQLCEFTKDCDFVYHFAAIHRPNNNEEFIKVNYNLFKDILSLLRKYNNACPVLYTSSIQANQNTDYGKSKKMAETALIDHAKEGKGKEIIYRLTNTFGKWAKPHGHSVVATFCYNIARNLDICIHNPQQIMNFYYIEDVIDSFIGHLKGDIKPPIEGIYQLDKNFKYSITLKELANLIQSFHLSRVTYHLPDLSDPFTKKLYSTYLSYLPCDNFNYFPKMYQDERGSFTEIFKTVEKGQLSVNITKPGVKKGEHYHNTKCEKFLVVSGKGVIQLRRIDSNEILNYYVSSQRLEIIDIPIGYSHNIMNIGESDLVTLIWANEIFDCEKADTYNLVVDIKLDMKSPMK